MKFSNVLKEAIEQDDGLVLRVAAFEIMLGTDPPKRGPFGRPLMFLIERVNEQITKQAWKLFGRKRAERANERGSRTCH